ncbi:MAG: LysR family transcriptional regulator, partial [Clostridia bacterium]|nr:LysR family transcriptional regulator [Clostridia bacterium]
MDISLGQLEAFVSVVENRSFSKAGEELFLSQSTISSHIAKLERALQATLLQRREKKNVEPTEEGMQAYRIAVQILNQAKALEDMFRQEAADQPIISIASSTVPSSYILPDILNGYNAARPECRFLVLDGDSSFALDRLQAGEAVFAFVGTKSRKSMICYHTVCRDRMVLITPKNSEYIEKKKAGVLGRELLDRPMILRESGSGTRRETDNYLKSIGVDPAKITVAAYMNNIEGIKSMVA